ncbi:DUF21 domain-containing protein [Anaerobaca lacustris]|uniref:DUF21 domain-containing protein n=1 Tax=Anaerobaca lacustris TaxID=3044600 RepID=A0AAW6U802_9BACT|nr:DUF21 domain-containing protein [Sedimentisphaerales bacterium M17dextr]
MTLMVWIAIVLCISQSGMLSGLNLAFFTLSKLDLELRASKNDKHARRVLAMRRDSNLVLVTILWGNVGVNVLLALLSGSVLTGGVAFVFSTVLITIIGEIVPQAYFSRHALRTASFLTPLLRLYQFVLFPVAKPTAYVLDRWLGPEAIGYFKEEDFRTLVTMHMKSAESDIDRVEGRGALNFLALDDLPLSAEGEPVDPESIVTLPFDGQRPVFPTIRPTTSDPFLNAVHRSQKKWVVVVDTDAQPRLVLDSDEFIRESLFKPDSFNPYRHCHRPILVSDPRMPLGEVVPRFRVDAAHAADDVIDDDIVLLWGDQRRILTGADLLGRLLRGIVRNERDRSVADQTRDRR